MHFADHFAGLELGARQDVRAVGGIPGINPNTTIAGAPQVTTAQEGSVANTTPNQLDTNAGKATETDAAAGAAILGNIRKKENDARASHDMLTVIDGVGADGTLSTQEWASIQALGVQDGASDLEMQAVRDAARQQAGIDSQNFQHSQESNDPETAKQDFAELYKRIQGGDAAQSQSAATELSRRYAAGVEWRGDIDIQIQLEARKLQTATNPDAKAQAQEAINRLKKQQSGLDASLVNIRTALKSSVEHGGALNGVRLNELRSKDNTIDSAAEANYAQQYGGKDGTALAQGLTVTQDGKLAAVVPAGGSIWKTVEQFPTPDGKFDQRLYDELVQNYGETVHPGQQLPLSKEATDRLRQNISLSPSDVSAAQVGGATVAVADQAKKDPNVLKNEPALNQAVQHFIDQPGEVYFDTGYGRKSFDDNDGGRATGHVRDLVAKFAAETGSTQGGIDKLVAQTQFDRNRASNTIAKEQFQRDLYAAYGVQAAAPRSNADGVTQALTDFVDGADDQKFSANGAVDVRSVGKLDAGQFQKVIDDIRAKLGNNATLSRETVAAYVNDHFFSHKDGTATKSAFEDAQRRQLTDQLLAALTNG
jgi:hypothetical protein